MGANAVLGVIVGGGTRKRYEPRGVVLWLAMSTTGFRLEYLLVSWRSTIRSKDFHGRTTPACGVRCMQYPI
jgi:hypothetical protein